MIDLSGNHFIPPLDDTFIHFQYAKRLSQGELFSYTEGEGYSTGATSVLYPIILAAFYLIGFSGIKLFIPAFLIGIFSLAATAVGIYYIGKSIADKAVGFAAGALILLNGNLLWNYFSGMETGLYAAFIVWIICCFSFFINTNKSKFFFASVILTALATITRPEGFYLAIFAIAPLLLWKRSKKIPASFIGIYILSLIPGIAYLLLTKIQTGSFNTNGMAVKGLLSNPYFNIWDHIQKIGETFVGIFSGYYSNIMGEKNFSEFQGRILYPYFPPFVLLFFIIGFFPKLIEELQTKKAMIFGLVFVWSFIGLLSTVALEWSFVHHQRYHAPYQPLFLLFVVYGIWRIAQLFAKNHKKIFFGISAGLAIFSLPSVLFWAAEYGENCNDIFNQQRRMSWYVKDSLPKDSVIGVTDAGAIAYFGEHKIYDLVGLVTNNQAAHFMNGTGSIYERLERLDDSKRPEYIITYDYWFGDLNFLGKEIYRITLLKNTITSGGFMSVHKQDWGFVNSGDRCYYLDNVSGYQIVDSLDVADIQSEKEHLYSFSEDSERRSYMPPPYRGNFFKKSFYLVKGQDDVPNQKEVWDGGRAITGKEKFILKTEPLKKAILVFRTDCDYEISLNAVINDSCSMTFSFNDSGKDNWKEFAFEIPSDVIRAGKTTIEINRVWDHVKDTPLRSFHYWILQEK